MIRAKPVSPSILAPRPRPRHTEVYDTYWRFAMERQRIFRARVRGKGHPWTNDEVLRHFRFTNAYRAADRTSQFLIRHVIYEGPQSTDDMFFRVLLFKIFNKIETWRLLENRIGPVSWQSYTYRDYDQVLSEALRGGSRIYSAAYIMPPPRGYGHQRKHRSHLALLESLMTNDYPRRFRESPTMRDAFQLLRGVPSFGDFLAYQYVTDLNYSPLTDFSECDFVMPGPGALSGVRKCFAASGGWATDDLIRMVAERQEWEFANRGLQFDDLWGRPLQLIDCQNLFCEVDKYARAAHPKITGLGGRTRIKRGFRPSGTGSVRPWFPPDWGINQRIRDELAAKVAVDGDAGHQGIAAPAP